MPFFQQCTAGTATLASAIADSAGASADTEMVVRAGKSYAAAMRHFNNYADWQWMLSEAPSILITAPFLITGCTASGGTNYVTTPNQSHGILPQDFVQGQMFSSNAAGRVTATATGGGGTGIIGFANNFNTTLIASAGAGNITVSANRDMYDLPTDFKQPYDARLLDAQYTIRFVGRRHYDRSVTSEFLLRPVGQVPVATATGTDGPAPAPLLPEDGPDERHGGYPRAVRALSHGLCQVALPLGQGGRI
jgi:hypothetical protein